MPRLKPGEGEATWFTMPLDPRLSTWHGRARRWNIEHNFVGTYAIWGLFVLGFAFLIAWVVG
jgi:hypothetical protein